MPPLHVAVIMAGLLLPGVALAQLGGKSEGGVSPAQRAMPMPSRDAGTARIPVVGADDLVGRPVRDRSGAPSGRVSHILVDPATGAVRDALIAAVPGLALGDQFIAVPWPHIALAPGGGPLTLDLAQPDLAAAPRIHAFSVAAGARPEVTAQIYGFDTTGGGASPPLATRTPPLPPGETEMPAPQGSTTVGPPVLVSATALRGVAVTTQDGRAFGEIGEPVIDTGHGYVAYVLIAEGGLRAPRAWRPVPIQILVPAATGYSLATADFWLRQVPPLPGPEAPGAVSSEWLRGLYDTFDVPPYWP